MPTVSPITSQHELSFLKKMPAALDLLFSLLFYATVSLCKSVILCFSTAGCTTRPASETNLPNSRTLADVRLQEAARTRLRTPPGTGTAYMYVCNIFTCVYLLKKKDTSYWELLLLNYQFSHQEKKIKGCYLVKE